MLTLPARLGPLEAPTPPAGGDRRAEDRFLRLAFWHHSRTFSLATRLLPPRERLPVATLYLYCRTVDTVADARSREVGIEAARDELERMHGRLDATLAGRPPADGPNELLWRRLAEVHARYRLLPHALHQLLDGARWDLDGRPVTTRDDLLAYSDLVAGSVGAMMLPFLVRDRADIERLEAPARALGNAMQITNILRDVGEDARDLGRVYLPADALAEAGLDAAALAADDAPRAWTPYARERYAALIEGLMADAEALYTEADAAVASLRAAARPGVRAAARMYREILNEVRAAGYDNLGRRAVVPTRTKLARTLAADGYARRRASLAPPALRQVAG